MDLDPIVTAIAQNWFWSVVCVIAVVSIVFGSIKSMVVHNSRERTRREIAAYIAEGSMTPEQGERLVRARPASVEDPDDE